MQFVLRFLSHADTAAAGQLAALRQSIAKAPHENLLGGWIMLLFGLFIAGIAALDSVPKLRAYGWVAGSALVTATDIYERTGRGHGWCGRVSYTYTVNGRNYKSRSMSSSLITDVGCKPDKAKVTARLARLPVGSAIRIFYDPKAPERVAMVRERLQWHDCLFWLMALVALAIGGYCIAVTRSVLKAQTAGRGR